MQMSREEWWSGAESKRRPDFTIQVQQKLGDLDGESDLKLQLSRKEKKMQYTHLNRKERDIIEVRLGREESYAEIGRKLGRHRSTIYREHKRNGKWNRKRRKAEMGDYEARLAQIRAKDRQSEKMMVKRKVRGLLKEIVVEKLKKGWSPEQISGRLQLEGRVRVSHESIYRYLLWDKKMGGDLYKYLRRCGRKRQGRYVRRTRFATSKEAEKRSIREREWAANLRTENGHWERDLMIGKRGQCAVLAMVDRRSGYLVAEKVQNRQSQHVNEVTFEAFDTREIGVRSLTNDRGSEFAEPKYLEERLNTKVYYADAMAAWQRGSVENTIGLLRQFFRKSESLENVDKKTLKQVEESINDRPRKRHGFKTPKEKHFEVEEKHIKSYKFYRKQERIGEQLALLDSIIYALT